MTNLGYIILTYRPISKIWEPFSRTTSPIMWNTLQAAMHELEQIKMNYPGSRFILGTVSYNDRP